jgi:thymidylate synthase (FAD)
MTQITAEYIDHMGDDLSVVRAARVSFSADTSLGGYRRSAQFDYVDGTRVPRLECGGLDAKDKKLITYLAKHHHWTPFAHTVITLRVSAPVPIRTQCFKHKQGFVENEESRRYIKSTPVLYVPESFRKAPEEGKQKQGSDGVHPRSDEWLDVYKLTCQASISLYEQMVAKGVCPEQARLVLPQGCIVNWYWTGSLAAFARFYEQRTDPHAQQEIQGLAKIIGGLIEPLFPISWKELTK